MALIMVRTVIVFLVLLIIMRLMGKRQIGEMQPFELVITLLISELACIPMADASVPLLYGIVSVVTIFVLHELVTLIDLKGKPFKALLSGKPGVVVNKNGIDAYELKRNRLDVSDLIESLRTAGYFSLDSIDYALYESNGTFSALPKKDYEEKTDFSPPRHPLFGQVRREKFAVFGAFRGVLPQHSARARRERERTSSCLPQTARGSSICRENGKKYQTMQVTYPGGRTW